MPEPIAGILFDLDGTFADTAPDLAAALNHLRSQRGQAEVPAAALRPYTSHGVRGMLGSGMGIRPSDPEYRPLYDQFLEFYAASLCRATVLFPGISSLIDEIERRGLQWGIVTNKQHRFTLPLMRALNYAARASCIVSGDSSPRGKPSPQPLLLAAALAGLDPQRCLYVGDDYRDIAAGAAAGMITVAVRYGYLGTGLPIEAWGASYIVDAPEQIVQLIG